MEPTVHFNAATDAEAIAVEIHDIGSSVKPKNQPPSRPSNPPKRPPAPSRVTTKPSNSSVVKASVNSPPQTIATYCKMSL